MIIESALSPHLACMLPKVGLTDEQRKKAEDLIREYVDIFVGESGQVGFTDKVRHIIDVEGQKPIKSAPYRRSFAERDELDRHIDQLLSDKKIVPSDSPWASPVVMVQKKDGSMRFCIDYRRVNKVTRKDAYPLPRIDDSLDSLAGSTKFSTLDLTSGYWQVAMEKKSEEVTAFCTHRGLFQWLVMPFGLSNAPATFERLMEGVLGDIQWTNCLVYLDDIIAFGSSFEVALNNLRMVFDRLRGANLKLKPKKCHLFEDEVEYLGHLVSEDGIKPCPSKVEAIKSWPVPKTLQDVRSFLGLASYYRKFIPNFSNSAGPLVHLTRKGVPFEWGSKQVEGFEALKEALISDTVLAYPKRDGLFTLDTDASLYGMGAVLSQNQNGEEKVIGYASKSFSRSQAKYCTTKRELLAVVNFVTMFRPYLIGHHFVIRTDHASLLWLVNFKQSDNMYCNWIMKLEQYDYEIQHRPGERHTNADSLSRVKSQDITRHCGRTDCPVCTSLKIEMSKPQQEIAGVPRKKVKRFRLQEQGEVSAVQTVGIQEEEDINWYDESYIQDMKRENYGEACPSNRTGIPCQKCSEYYMDDEESEEECESYSRRELYRLVVKLKMTSLPGVTLRVRLTVCQNP